MMIELTCFIPAWIIRSESILGMNKYLNIFVEIFLEINYEIYQHYTLYIFLNYQNYYL